jgi:hypothetical protein
VKRSTLIRLSPSAGVVLLVALAGLGMRPGPSPRVDGEYGLWVEDRRDSLIVHWQSTAAEPGMLAVDVDARHHEYKTPASTTHAVSMARPPRNSSVRLMYGTTSSIDTTTLRMQYPARYSVVNAADSVFVLGDTHGEFETTLKTLRHAKLIDDHKNWIGGRKQLVFIGDLVDRGEDVLPLLWFVYQLEQDAARAGGRVHVLLGNHETMVWMDDLRYVQPKEMKLAATYGIPYPKLYDLRESVLGKWLATKPAVLRLDNILFAHGGVSSEFLRYTPQMVDDSLAKFSSEEWFYHYADTAVKFHGDSASYARRARFFMGENSVFWYRGYLQSDTLGDQLEAVLRRFGAVVHVVGHTPTQMVHSRYGGRLIAAHPRTPAIEMVVLIKNGRNWDRWRIDQAGNRTILPAAP